MAAPHDKLTAKGRRTKAHIVEVAAPMLLQRGIAATTMEDIQQGANVSASQLYHYFAGKRELVAAVIESQTEVILANDLISQMSTLRDLHQWRDAVVTAARRFGHRAGCPLAALGEQIRDTDPELLDLIAQGLTRLTELVARGLDVIRANGELRAEADTHRLAVVAVTAYEGGLLMAQIQGDVTALEIALDTAIAAIEAHGSESHVGALSRDRDDTSPT